MSEPITRRSTLAIIAASSLPISGDPYDASAEPNAPSITAQNTLFLAGGDNALNRPTTEKLRETAISIVDYGAIGDGDPVHAVRNAAAIQAAIRYAASLLPRRAGFAYGPEIFVPPGIFVVAHNALAPPDPVMGLRIRGSGWLSSVLRLSAAPGSERWIFDNSEGGERLAFPMFTDLCFEGRDMSVGASHDVPPGAGLMRIASHHVAQGFRFERCLFQGFDVCFCLTGSNLASESKFIDCKFYGCETVAKFSNSQSFNTDFIGTEIEEIYGSVFHFLRSTAGPGGGAVRVSHSSVIAARECAIVRMDSSMINQGVVISNSRIELRGKSRLFQGMSENAYGELTIVDCGILNTEITGVRQIAAIGCGQTLRFVRCQFNTLGQTERYAFIPQINHYMAGPRLLWDDCQIPFDVASKIDNRGEGNHAGQASARFCRTNEAQGNDLGVIHAADFDLYGQGGTNLAGPMHAMQGADAHMRRKTVALKIGTSSWPYLNDRGQVDAETRLVLPPHARIMRIVIVKEPQGSSTAMYGLRVRTESGVSLLDTPPGPQNTAIVAHYDPESVNHVPYGCGESLRDRTIVLTCSPQTASGATDPRRQGYAYLEYF